MHISPVGFFVYRPFFKVSRYCSDKLTALYEKAHSQILDNRYAKSILGRVVTCSAAETIGGLAGGYAGGALMGTALKEIGKYGFPVFLRYQTPLLTLFVLQHKTSRLALTLLGITAAIQFAVPLQTLSEWGAIGGLFLGELSGKWIGTILGGYAGLVAMQSTIPFWDDTIPCDSYLVGMSKYLFVGEVFDTVVARSTLPYLNLPINIGRGCMGLIVKTVAYNSNPVISTLKDSFRGKKISHEVLIPLFVKMFCSRYCEANSVPITSQLINIVSQTINVIPEASHQFRFLLRQPALFGPLETGVHHLSLLSDKFATIFMRAFRGYVGLFQKSPTLQEAYRKYLTDLNAVFFSLYGDSSSAHKIARTTRNIAHALLVSFFGFKKWIYPWIEQLEEKAVLLSKVEIKEEHYAPPKTNLLQGPLIENYGGP